MEYRKYVPGTPAASVLGLGAWQLGEESGWRTMSEKEALYLVEEALAQGINFFDTAPNYGQGTSELRLGKALQHHDRSQLVINTKFGHTATGGTDYRPESIRESLDGSLRRLRTDYVDSLIIHSPPFELLDGTAQPHYEILARLQEEGKIRAYGASLDTYAEMERFLATTDGTVIEAFFNILHQDTARAFGTAQDQGVAIIAKIPLDSGWLSGKYHAASTFTGVRSRWSRQDIETRAALLEKVKRITGTTDQLAQRALAFCLAFPAVTTVIPGSSSVAQLKDNLRSLEHPLSPAEREQLQTFYEEEVKALELPW